MVTEGMPSLVPYHIAWWPVLFGIEDGFELARSTCGMDICPDSAVCVATVVVNAITVG